MRLTDEERQQCERVIDKLQGSSQKVKRAHILLMDTHTKGAFYEVFEPERARSLVRRIESCYTPKHGSWLNIAEHELSSLTRQCVAGRRFQDVATLREETAAWSSDVNIAQCCVDWQMRMDDARTKLKSVYPTIKV